MLTRDPVRSAPPPRPDAAAALVPHWVEFPIGELRPLDAFRRLAGDGPGVILEELALDGHSVGYTIVAGDPAAMVLVDRSGVRVEGLRRPLPLEEGEVEGDGGGQLEGLRHLLAKLRAPGLPQLPTMTGGLAGVVSYEAAQLLQGLAHPGGRGRPPLPPMVFLVLDRVLVFDHHRGVATLVAHVPPMLGAGAGRAALEELQVRLRRPALGEAPGAAGSRTLAVAPNIPADRFRAAVARVKQDIARGEVYQAVLSRRLAAPCGEGGLEVYQRLRRLNPSPAMVFLRAHGVELAGSSPEPLLKVQGRRVSTRPIAGTRRRGRNQREDLELEAELTGDEKELAEHAMLVDLARNDLGRVCLPGSVLPTELRAVQRLPRVMHLVSTVEGELAEGQDALDALRAVFPAGTVTGAPKRRAMEIIAREESTYRGPYGGACGYLTFSGDLEFCITIRTAVVAGGQVQVQAGAGIVADSDPGRELAETEAKASAILAAMRGSR
ncbi:MAG: anthranilate synthase component I family protein [Candidatus Dormibacteria bacterium]